MKSINHLLAVFLFFFLHTSLAAQEQSAVADLSVYASRIDTFSRYYPHEKVYLHFDNTSYFLGDTIWFKAYLVDAVRHLPDNWSRTLYVELVTQEGDITITKKYKTTGGQCHGFLALRDSLWSGYYEVRAYTRWMLNFGSGHEFSRVFPVFDKPRNKGDYHRVMRQPIYEVPNYRKDDLSKLGSRHARNYRRNNSLKSKKPLIEMDFFPEGGHLVKGLSCRVAFKVSATDSSYVNAKGRIYDAEQMEVVSFSTLHEDMGVFELTPSGGSYTAEIDVEGEAWKFPLPTVENEGCVFHVNTLDPSKIHLYIHRSDSCRNQVLGLTVMCRGRVYVSAELPASSHSVSMFSISRDELPTGVNQVTLFNASGEVLAERLFFVRHDNRLRIDLVQDKDAYKPFEQISLDVSIRDKKNEPVPTTFSLAVRDGETSLPGNDSDILSYLLLSSEIRGYVHNLEYYFEGNDRTHQYALDLLMMTQGWSRYVWKRLAGVERFKIQHPAEENISMDGIVQLYHRKFKPLADAEVLMWMTGNGVSYREKGQTDENGNFVFAFDFSGTYKLSLQVKKEGKRKNCDIRLNRFRTPPLRQLSFYERQFPQEEFRKGMDTVASGLYADRFMKDKDIAAEILLNEVQVKAKRLKSLKDASVIYNVRLIMDKLKDMGEDKVITVFGLLSQINPYYHSRYPICDDKGNLIYTEDTYKGRPVLYLRDSYRARSLVDVDPETIKLISIEETPGVASSYNIKALPKENNMVVINIYTDYRIRNAPRGIRTTSMDGYALVKEFYNPRYDRKILPNETDYRRTLYWNPNVRTDSLGQARVTFYNNGTCKRMNVSAQTVTSDGRIGTTGQ